MIEASIIYTMIRETNHLNRMLNHIGESSEKNLTPRNRKIINLINESPEGGRYMCASLFGDNYGSLTIDQARFIVNLENWEPLLDKKKNEEDEALYVEYFKKQFIVLNKPKKDTDRIRMMNSEIKKPENRLCYRPY